MEWEWSGSGVGVEWEGVGVEEGVGVGVGVGMEEGGVGGCITIKLIKLHNNDKAIPGWAENELDYEIDKRFAVHR